MLQSLPLEIKVAKSKLRIQEWIDYYGKDKVYEYYNKYDDNGNLICTKYSSGYEIHYEYNENNKCIHTKTIWV